MYSSSWTSLECYFSAFFIRLPRSKYIFGESSFLAFILVLFFTLTQFQTLA